MNRLIQLQQRKQALTTQAQAALAAARARVAAAGPDATLTDAERAADDALQAQIDAVNQDIRIEQRSIERAAETPGSPIITGGGPRVLEDPKRGYRDIAEFARDVRLACAPGASIPTKLIEGHLMGAPTNFHQEAGTVEGGMVPPAMANDIWDVVEQQGSMLDLLTAQPTNSNRVKYQADETTPWGASGVQAKWRVEGGLMDATKLATNERTFDLHELYAFVLATDDMVLDAPRLADRLTKKSGAAINWKASDALANGDGVGKPLGFMKSGALVTILKEAGQAAGSIVAANTLKMRSRLLSYAGGKPFYLHHPEALPQIAVMTIGNQPVWTSPNQGIQGNPFGSLHGLPLVPSDHCEVLGTKGDVMLVEPAGYQCAIGRSLQGDSSIHLFFDYGITAYRWRIRIGGTPVLSAPIAAAKGNTRSHFLVVETRA